MRAIATLVGITLMAAIPIAGALAQQPASPPATQQALLVGSDSLVGSAVRDTDGHDIGKVSRLMIDPADGRVSSVIIATGGTLGVGANAISVPWGSIKVGQERGKVVVTASQMLEAATPRAAPPAPVPPAAPPAAAPPANNKQ